MSALEKRATFGLASIFALRMLGMFIILPVFALYAEHLPGGQNHILVGLALGGAYGLSQAILQIPFGWASDRYGRKPLLYLGLCLFAIGSFVAAGAENIWWVIIGRALQGSGAVSGVVLAMTADLTRDQHRTKAMALIGMTIGVTFAVSMAISPWLAKLIGVPGIFALTGGLALAALLVVYQVIPTPQVVHSRTSGKSEFAAVLRNTELMRLNLGIFVLHAALAALFVVIPFSLRDAGLAPDHHWQVYLPVMLAAFVFMVPAIIFGEKKFGAKRIFVMSIAVLFCGQLLLGFTQHSLLGLTVALAVFFTAFNLLEASLPSMVSQVAPAGTKGTATGIYSSIQFLGVCVGPTLGGFVSQRLGNSAVFWLTAVGTLAWLLVASTMRPLASVRLTTYTLRQMDEPAAKRLAEKLMGLPGVYEAVVLAKDGIAHLKVEKSGFDESAVLRLIGAASEG
ncbi:MAG: MFS transporter [Pseudomonadota bacterium]